MARNFAIFRTKNRFREFEGLKIAFKYDSGLFFQPPPYTSSTVLISCSLSQ